MQKIFASLFTAILMTCFMGACTTSPQTQKRAVAKPPSKIEKQMAAILAASGSNEMLFIEVSSPNNLISEKIMLASLVRGGSSTGIDQLKNILSSGKNSTVGIVGKSQEINAITVKRTLEELQAKPASGTVYLITDAKTQESLKALNQSADIKLVLIE